MEDAVFLDNDFAQDFLTGDSERLERVLEDCRQSSCYSEASGRWLLPAAKQESELYNPIVRILNTIKRAVDRSVQANDDDETDDDKEVNNCAGADGDSDDGTDGGAGSDDEFQFTLPRFLNHSASAIPSDDFDSINIKPDIVLFEGQHEHWETVRLAIEVKLKPEHLREGMKQLSRYARAMYAHQLHRRHLYGLVVCGSKATFVRYDRAGIIHSPEIDMCESFEVFTKAFASWLMLSRTSEGYDTAFSTTANESGRLEYYVDLPESIFEDAPAEPNIAGPSRGAGTGDGTGSGPGVVPTRRFKVVERLCHRKSIRGRATIVLRIREVVDSGEATDEEGGKGKRKEKGKDTAEGNTKKRKVDEIDEQQQLPHYILKLIWRDPLRESEGDVMRILRGMFALAQYVWHGDVAGECQCGMDGACGTCVDETPRPANLERSKIMGYNKDTSVQGRRTKSTLAGASRGDSGKCVRKHRIYSRILMSSVGEPMWVANTVNEFLTAILDAILGYWRLVNLGILHRDISDGNVMLLRGVQTYRRREWLEDRSEDVEALRKQFGAMTESELELRKVLNGLNRDPSGMVTDFDLHTKHSSSPISDSTDDALHSTCESGQATPLPRSGMSPTSQTLPNQNLEQPSKRLKTNSSTSVPVSTNNDDPMAWLFARFAETGTPTTPKPDESRPRVDLRTGTPTFMSLRVLETKGARYTHNFMDDLESFFWLLVWSVAAHIDPDRKSASDDASYTLQMLDNDQMETISMFKSKVLKECSDDDGQKIFVRLHSFTNEWASHPSFIWLIFKMGTYFYSRVYSGRGSPEDPGVVFPEIVKMVTNALSIA